MSEISNMCCESNRLKTFENWPIDYINPKDLAAAGFYYDPLDIEKLEPPTPQMQYCIEFLLTFLLLRLGPFQINQTSVSDNVQCFSCGVQINKWERDDIPFVEHKRWSPSCCFVRSVERAKASL